LQACADEPGRTVAGLEDMLVTQTAPLSTSDLPLNKLAGYYAHLFDLARGYEKDPIKLEKNLRHVRAWQADVEESENYSTRISSWLNQFLKS
jgi:hypothetical protein